MVLGLDNNSQIYSHSWYLYIYIDLLLVYAYHNGYHHVLTIHESWWLMMVIDEHWWTSSLNCWYLFLFAEFIRQKQNWPVGKQFCIYRTDTPVCRKSWTGMSSFCASFARKADSSKGSSQKCSWRMRPNANILFSKHEVCSNYLRNNLIITARNNTQPSPNMLPEITLLPCLLFISHSQGKFNRNYRHITS